VTDDRIQRLTMPKWGLSMKTGKIIEWFVGEGDLVGKGDDLADIETEKIAGTLESPLAGPLRRIVAEPGVDLPVGATLAVVAPAEVSDDEIEAVVAEARAQLESGELGAEDEVAPSTVLIDGRSISYLTLGEAVGGAVAGGAVAGAGDPVVLVHGFGGDKNSWLFVQQPLSETHLVYALDLPGHGQSGKDVGDGSLDTLAAVVLGLLDEVGAGRAHLVGHSLGGAVVAAVAAAAPDRVASLTLLAPAGFGSAADAEYLRGFAAAASRRELKPLLGRLFADESQVTRQLVDDLLKYKRLDGVAEALHTLLGTLLAGDRQAIELPALLGKVAGVPVTVVWGDEDRILPVPDGVELALVKAGHMLHMEAANDVLRHIRATVG